MYANKSLPQNPREKANIFSNMFYCYTIPLFFKGRKKPLVQSDLYKELKEHKSETLGFKLNRAWEKELEEKAKPSLLRATLRVFGFKIFLYGVALGLIEFLFKYSEPYLLSGIIANYYNNKIDITETYLYAASILLTIVLNIILLQSYITTTLHMGMKIRIAMCSMIYRKALKIRKTSLGDITVGQIVNLISNDVGRLNTSIIFLHYIWLGPLETIICSYLMNKALGVAAFVGIGVMVICIPLEIYLGKKNAEFREKTAKISDQRFRIMNEIIEGIKVIKIYAWEKAFSKLINDIRRKEIKVIQNNLCIRGILLSFGVFITRLSIFLSLTTHILLGNSLSAEDVFVITAYYYTLKRTMTTHFPQSIANLAESIVSFKRIQKFMQYDEFEIHKPIKSTNLSNVTTQISKEFSDINNVNIFSVDSIENISSPIGIEISNVKAKWDPSSNEYTLENINLKAKPGTLIAIIGPVGSGKSSLIQAILGELPIQEGKIEVYGSISYFSQDPWLFSGTIRQNILFGLPLDAKRYKSVIEKCDLNIDLESMHYGDKTFIGEKGSTLSGGQRTRICLARAIYRKSLIYLLDDPLSAVDVNVGSHLFNECIKEFLSQKIVVLVTHQLQYLQHADEIIYLEHGQIKAMGSYESLYNSGLDISNLFVQFKKIEEMQSSQSSATLKKYASIDSSAWSLWTKVSENNPFETEEDQNKSTKRFELYKKYFKAAGGCHATTSLLAICSLAQLSTSGYDWFSKQMIKRESNKSTTNMQSNNVNTNYSYNIHIFTILAICTIAVTIYRNFFFFNIAMKASQNLHNKMFNGVIRATMRFYNVNPTGRILNRFGSDLGEIDEMLPTVMLDVIQNTFQLIGILTVLAIIKPTLLIPAFIIGTIFYSLRTFYLKTSMRLKRIDSIARSPIYSHLGETLNGLSTIRAFNAQPILIKKFDKYQNLHSSSFFMLLVTSRAFGFWLDCLCFLYICIVILSFFVQPENGSDVGLAITQAMSLTGMLQWGVRQSAEMENNMAAVERVVEYETIDQEAEFEAKMSKKPPKDWPQNGRIKFDNLSLRYSMDSSADLILKSLQFEIEPKEKIGIVGRTGAGKSSLINALFRLSYTEGSIIIDGRNINKMGLHDLRKKISIIPQEPVLFSGTMRYNLDPFNEYSDAKIWEALALVDLKTLVTELPLGLHSKISEGGSNFSVGQRQLICLARAILRENKILVMDEATANVDAKTDSLIQTTIRSHFKECTVLTIVHRLQTVMDSDKVLVIDNGTVAEYGTPYDLLTNSNTQKFKKMVKRLGKNAYDEAFAVAEKIHNEKFPPGSEQPESDDFVKTQPEYI